MSAIATQITNLVIVYSTIYAGADQRKHQSSASLAFVWEIHQHITFLSWLVKHAKVNALGEICGMHL